jgi:hypothetical protein
MKIITANNQIVNIENIDILKVTEINDYVQVSIMKKEKFKLKELTIDLKYESVEKFDADFNKRYIGIGDNLYIKLDKILMIDMVRVEDTIHSVDMTIHMVVGEPFSMRTTDSTYDRFLRRLREC